MDKSNKMTEKVIWLDDLRNPINYNVPEALWCKTYKEFIRNISCGKAEEVTEIHLDHDLGDGEGWTERTGYDAFKRIELILFQGGFKNIKTIYIHTSNPSAAEKFMLAKESLLHYGIKLIRKHY